MRLRFALLTFLLLCCRSNAQAPDNAQSGQGQRPRPTEETDGVTLPGAALPGACVARSASMKMNWSGGGAQSNCVPCAAWPTLVILSSNSVPDPESGVKSFE